MCELRESSLLRIEVSEGIDAEMCWLDKKKIANEALELLFCHF